MMQQDKIPVSQEAEEDLDPEETANAVALQCVAKNDMVMAGLTLALESDTLLGMIDNNESMEWPDGLVYQLVNTLHREYTPSDWIDRVSLCAKFVALSLKENENPVQLFEKTKNDKETVLKPEHQ